MNLSGIYKIQSICKPERVYIGARVGVKMPLHTEETKEKMRKAQRERRLNNPVSEETKIRMRHPRSAEFKQKIKDSWVVRKQKTKNHV